MRELVLLLGGVACLVYAFLDGNPAWIGAGGALLGGDLLVRAHGEAE